MDDAVTSVTLGKTIDPTSGGSTVHLELTNEGDNPIVVNLVQWVYFYEKPLDATEEFIAKHGQEFKKATGRTVMKVEETGRRYSFAPVEEPKNNALGPKE